MIAKMSKYAFVLYAAQSDDFIGRLRELGLTDRIMALRMKKYGITYKEFRRKRTRPE